MSPGTALDSHAPRAALLRRSRVAAAARVTALAVGLVDPTVERRALHGAAAHAADERLDLLGRRVLAGVRAGLARDALLHEGTAEVVAPGAKRELRQAMAELHPRRLQVVDHATQDEAAGGIDAKIPETLRLRCHLAVVVELGVLPDEAERDELGEAAGLLLDAPHEVEVPRDVT